MKRIGIDARFFGTSAKGLGRYTQRLIEHLELIDQEHEFVIFLRKENWDAYVPSQGRFRKVLADYRWYSVEEQMRFPRILAREKCTLVHFPHFNVPVRFTGHFVVTIHDLILTHYPTQKASTLGPLRYFIKQLGYRYVIRRAVNKADRIITVSDFTRNDLVKHFALGDSRRITVITEGVDRRQQETPDSRKKEVLSRLRLVSPYLLYVGNMYPHKNLERYLEAFVAVVQGTPDLTLALVGKDDYFVLRLKNHVRHLGLENNVRFLGYVDDSDLSTLYQCAEAFVFPSLYEGFGLPPLEAMAYGTPVIASKVSSIPEVLGDAAEYFDPTDIHDMMEATRRILTDRRRRAELQRKGIERVSQFSWEAMAKKTLDLYRTVT